MARKFVAVDLKERPWGKINPTFGLVGEKWNNDISSPSLSDGLNYFMINNKHPFIFEKNEKFFDFSKRISSNVYCSKSRRVVIDIILDNIVYEIKVATIFTSSYSSIIKTQWNHIQ